MEMGQITGVVMDPCNGSLLALNYPLVNLQKTMDNHHFQWENPLFLWPFSIAILNYQRVSLLKGGDNFDPYKTFPTELQNRNLFNPTLCESIQSIQYRSDPVANSEILCSTLFNPAKGDASGDRHHHRLGNTGGETARPMRWPLCILMSSHANVTQQTSNSWTFHNSSCIMCIHVQHQALQAMSHDVSI